MHNEETTSNSQTQYEEFKAIAFSEEYTPSVVFKNAIEAALLVLGTAAAQIVYMNADEGVKRTYASGLLVSSNDLRIAMVALQDEAQAQAISRLTDMINEGNINKEEFDKQLKLVFMKLKKEDDSPSDL